MGRPCPSKDATPPLTIAIRYLHGLSRASTRPEKTTVFRGSVAFGYPGIVYFPLLVSNKLGMKFEGKKS